MKLSNPVNATLATDGTLATGTITDNDDPTELSIGDATAVIEGGSALFVVSMGASEKQVTVSYETEDGTAEEPGDYTSTSGTLTFVAGATTKTVTVVTANDTVDEADGETFKVKLSNPVNATLATDGTLATGTITDNDDPTELSIGDATAVIEGDYTSTSGTLTFAAGDRVKTITVTTEDDELDEADEETFAVKLSNPVNATLATDGTTATGTISDNDDPTELSIGDATAVIEGGSASFEVSLSVASGRVVTVSYETEDGTAEEPGDYTSTSGTLTFVAGATTKTVTVVTANDTVDEADGETFKVKLSNPVNATLATDGTLATGTITDNDDPTELSIGDATAVIEGGSASFVVSMGASEKQVTVSYETEDGTAEEPGDYTSTSGTLTFAAGATTKTVTVVTANDTVDEADGETFKVKLSNPVNATLATDGTLATGTISDNDHPAVLAITNAPAVIEGATASFVVSMGASEKQVTVSYETEDGTAEEPGDYTSTSGALTFVAGATTKTVTVVTANDTVDEADGETFKVKLSNPVNATLATDGTLATGTITDNDDPAELSIGDATAVIEGGSASFVVSMGASEKQVTVSYETEDGTAEEPGDYTSTSGTLTFVAGATTKTVTVVTANDTVDEADGETFAVKLSNPVNATLATDGTLATGTITDNDDPTELSIGDATAVIEGATASFVVSMGASEKQVTVSYETEDGTAEEPGDYTSTSGTLTFAAGATTKTVTVVTANDTVDEADGETFTVKLSNPVNATLATDGTLATGTISDNDDPTELAIGDATAVIEGGSASFVVSMGASEKQVTVSYETEDGTAEEPGDYTSTSGTLTFAAGATTKTVTVVTANDTVDEADGETFKVKLSNPVNAALATDGTLATGTITDNDDPAELSIRDATAVIEGAMASFVVSMGASEKQVTVSYETEDGTAEEPGDYTSTSGTLTFVAGATTKTVTVVTANDTVDEADGETFKVKLSNPVNATLATDGTLATGTITDNDDPAELSIGDATAVIEGGSASFVVSMGASEKQVTVSYETEDGTAEEPGDYTSTSGTLTFVAGATTKTVTVVTANDTVDEADGETFKVKLSNPVNAALATDGTLATGTITDNDDPAELSIGDATAVIEGATALFVVSMGASEKQVTVSYETEDGTAEEPGDYTSTSGTLTFVAGATTKTVTVVTANDTVDEADGETFKVKLSNPVNAALATDGTTATGTITDNDDLTELSIGDATAVIEGGSASFVVSMGASEKQVTVSYETEDGTAEEPGDYTSTSGTLTFAAGATTKTVTVVTANDTVDEADGETFKVKLSNPVNATLATDGTLATGTISDNDVLSAEVSADSVSVDEGEDAVFTVSVKDGTSTADVVVEYAVDATSTATADEDYTAPSPPLTIKAGETSGKITIKTLDTDEVLDPGETLVVRLTSASTDTRTVTVDATAKVTTTIADTNAVEVTVSAVKRWRTTRRRPTWMSRTTSPSSRKASRRGSWWRCPGRWRVSCRFRIRPAPTATRRRPGRARTIRRRPGS